MELLLGKRLEELLETIRQQAPVIAREVMHPLGAWDHTNTSAPRSQPPVNIVDHHPGLLTVLQDIQEHDRIK